MKVVSFKIEDSVYKALRSKKVSFRVLFEPLAIELAQNNSRATKYTGGIPQNFSQIYIELVNIQKIVDKVIKSCDFEKKKELL